MEKYKHFPGSSNWLPRQETILKSPSSLFHKVKYILDVLELIVPNLKTFHVGIAIM